MKFIKHAIKCKNQEKKWNDNLHVLSTCTNELEGNL